MTDERSDIDTFALEEPTATEAAEAEEEIAPEAPSGDAAPNAESLESTEEELGAALVEDDPGIAWADPAGEREAWAEADWVEDAPPAPEEAAVQITEDLPPEMQQPSEGESEAALSAPPLDVDPSETAEPVAAETPSVDPARQIEEALDPEAAARAALGLDTKVEPEELAPEEAAAILRARPEEEVVEEAVVDLDDADLLDVFDEEDTEPSPYDRPGSWYVVHTYSGYEKKVKSNLESRIKSLNMEDRIHEIVIPMDDVIEFKGGKKTVVQKKVFPGYLLVRMRLDDDSWGAVRNTPGVTGFVGSGAKPVPLSRKEVESILRVRPEGEQKKARPRLEYEVGDQVRVTAGPFADFNGIIDEINVDQNTLKVLVNIFGRETPVTLDFADVAKL